MFKIAIICGGPSLERGISLNSARSILDHIQGSNIEVLPLYVDHNKNFYSIQSGQLYSNTPADFDFKLDKMAKKLNHADLVEFFSHIDLAFPLVHGPFGEDGELQEMLEKMHVPYIGPDSASCKQMFLKHKAFDKLNAHHFPTLPMLLLTKGQKDMEEKLSGFFQSHKLTRAVVKPSSGGSSIGVASVKTPAEALEHTETLISKNIDTEVVIEPFFSGVEFTVVVFENHLGEPVALVPTEIETSYENGEIFDYRKKYLATNSTAYHTPPRFSAAVIQHICREAEKLFKLFKIRDFVRMDGWLMSDNTPYFTDFNPISGLEQNSFLFRQAAVVGLTHQQAISYIIETACKRYGLKPPVNHTNIFHKKMPVHVLFGGANAERQVSLMSGTNIWLKLLKSELFHPIPFLYDPEGNIWRLPYSYTLNHTVEEIYANCLTAEQILPFTQAIVHPIQAELGLKKLPQSIPERNSLEGFIDNVKKTNAFVFIAMHGGVGENGTLQRYFEAHDVPYNGSGSSTSALCMDKYATGEVIAQIGHPDIFSLPKKACFLNTTKNYSKAQFEEMWHMLCRDLNNHQLIIKPRNDGCSAGIVRLQSAQDLERYCHFIHQKVKSIPAHSFASQSTPIEMPSDPAEESIFESFIEIDSIAIQKQTLIHKEHQGWIELTVGVLEKDDIYHALNPSIAIAEGAVLSLEEKFQGGTGINITPPPEELISPKMTGKIKEMIEITAKALGIQNYARIDIFFNRLTGKMIVIEANSLPGMTPSTVIYHQALAETPSMPPLAFLERLIDSASKSPAKV